VTKSIDDLGIVTFALGSGSLGCSVTPEGLVTILGATTAQNLCTITASIAGTARYDAAGPIADSFAIAKAGQGVAFTSATPTAAVFGGTYVPGASGGSSGNPVTFGAIGACTFSGGIVRFAAAGPCTVTADQAGSGNYDAAPQATQAFTIARAGQTISLSAPATKTLGDADFTVSASATSGLPVTLTAGGGCTVSGTTVHLTAVGPCTITATQAGDGNYTAATPVSATIAVIWPFTGFFSPVDNLPILNISKAGSTIPVKFSLGGNRGLSVLANGYPLAVKITCGTGVPTDVIEETNTSNSGLAYDSTSNQYTYNWKTPKAYVGLCYRLDVKFVDGTTHSANFQFK